VAAGQFDLANTPFGAGHGAALDVEPVDGLVEADETSADGEWNVM